MNEASCPVQVNEASGPPLTGERQAVVDCGEFRCLGFQRADGKWRDSKGNQLPEVVRVILEF